MTGGKLLVADRRLRTLLLVHIDNREPLVVDPRLEATAQQVIDVFGDAVELLGSDHQIHMRRRFDERVPARLGHAAEIAENEVRARLPELAEHPHFSDRLLFGHVADAARVEKDDVRVRLVWRHAVAALAEHLGDLFRVALVHLAAVGFDVDAGHWRQGKIAHTRGRARMRIEASSTTLYWHRS